MTLVGCQFTAHGLRRLLVGAALSSGLSPLQKPLSLTLTRTVSVNLDCGDFPVLHFQRDSLLGLLRVCLTLVDFTFGIDWAIFS